jgi:hypothetical protein
MLASESLCRKKSENAVRAFAPQGNLAAERNRTGETKPVIVWFEKH